MSIRSSTGAQLDRAELFAPKDVEEGEYSTPAGAAPKWCRFTGQQTRTPSNLTHLTPREEAEERAVREARAHALLNVLTAEEREALRLRDLREGSREVRHTIGIGELDERLAAGWEIGKPREKGARTCEVVKSFPRTLTYEEMGERMGLSARQVHRRISSAHRKLRDAKGAR